MRNASNSKKWRTWLRHLITFAMFGSMMFALKVVMMSLPNIHPLGMFIMLLTVVYRWKALIPIYIYVILDGIFFPGVWWFPYLYIWAILWGTTMLLPKNMKPAVAAVVYPVVCGLFGLLFGVFYAPAEALFYGFDLKQTLAWIAMGTGFDILHAVGNAAMGCLVLPLSTVLLKLERKMGG